MSQRDNTNEQQLNETPRRVLVVEDETIIRLDIVELLNGAGYNVVAEADNGEEAVKLAHEHRPDVVLMDVQMPIKDGITAAEEIVEAEIAPVVLLTAYSQPDLVARAQAAGAMAYVVKPFTEQDLVPAIEVAVGRFEQMSALKQEIGDLKQRFETRKLVDRAKSLLTEKMNLSEPEAFRWIQKTSMNKRLSMQQVAEAVIEQLAEADED